MKITASPQQSTPTPWNGTIARTRFFDALSLMLPAGESFVIDALEAWAAESGGPDAFGDSDLARFIREERAHQRAHDLYNRALIAEAPSACAAERRAERATAGLRALPLVQRVALAAAFEQLTAVLSHEVLAHRHLLAQAGSSAQARLWRWHAAEELRHFHVATQAARAYGVGGLRRIVALCLATAFLALDLLRGWIALCADDVAAGAPRRTVAIDALRFAIQSMPTLARMAAGWLLCLVVPYRERRTV
jgi:predicted metal-dependent hydrolase